MSSEAPRRVSRHRVPRDVDYGRPHYLYRAFDGYGLLLYVGCSLAVEKRIATHRRSAWFRFADTIAVAGPWDRSEARRLEREAIESESPFFAWSYAEMVAVQANNRAAARSVTEGGYPQPRFTADAWEHWFGTVERERGRLKATTHPYLTAEDRLARPACPDCDYIHVYGDAVAVGRFQVGGPLGYQTADGEIHPTREAAQKWLCEQRQANREPGART